MDTASSRDRGASLVEVLFALALVAVMSAGVATLFGVAARAAHHASVRSTMATAARMRWEQLQGLTWVVGGSGEIMDQSTDLTTTTGGPGGTGLSASPVDALEHDVPGYVDYLDAQGRWVGAGPGRPAAAAFTRRWRIRAIADAAWPTISVQVAVVDASEARRVVVSGGKTRRRR